MSTNIKRTNYYKDGMLRINVLDFDFGERLVWNHFDEEGNKIESTDEVCLSIADDCDYQVETLVMGDDAANKNTQITNKKNNSTQHWKILLSSEDDTEIDEFDALMDALALEIGH